MGNSGAVKFVEMDCAYEACTRILNARPKALTPDRMLELGKVVNQGFMRDWEEKADEEIVQWGGLYDLGSVGKLLVATEYCFFTARKVFSIEVERLPYLVREHSALYGESFVTGDVIVVEAAGTRIWVFHHEGLYATVVAAQKEFA